MPNLRTDKGRPDRAPMPEGNRERIYDRVLCWQFMPGPKLSLQQKALALRDLWPGVEASQVRSLIAGLAYRETRIRQAMNAAKAERTARLESG